MCDVHNARMKLNLKDQKCKHCLFIQTSPFTLLSQILAKNSEKKYYGQKKIFLVQKGLVCQGQKGKNLLFAQTSLFTL